MEVSICEHAIQIIQQKKILSYAYVARYGTKVHLEGGLHEKFCVIFLHHCTVYVMCLLFCDTCV